MKNLLNLLLLFPVLFFSQKKQKLEVYFSIEAKAMIMKGLGNNVFSQVTGSFFGYGFGVNFKTNKKIGAGFEFNKLKANVKYEEQSKYGSIGFPSMTNIDAYLFHISQVSEEFEVEESAGLSTYRIRSPYDNTSTSFLEGNNGFNLGLKGLYNLDREGFQQAFLGLKFNYYRSKVYNENPDIEKFYSKSFFLNLCLGYRYNF